MSGFFKLQNATVTVKTINCFYVSLFDNTVRNLSTRAFSGLPAKNEKVVSDLSVNLENISKSDTLVKVKNEQVFEGLMKDQFFYLNSSSIYGGLKGAHDFGPCGCSVKNNIINLWRDKFISGEGTHEIDTSILTHKRILEASGHLHGFNDGFVKDDKSGLLYRCDHVIENHLEKRLSSAGITENERQIIKDRLNRLKEMNLSEMENLIKEYNIKGPDNGNLCELGKINLLFSSKINFSETADNTVYFRPETAQGMFTNFLSLVNFNHGKLPFGVGQIGTSFRNEISPRNKLIRAREFQMAEIEYFYNPKFTGHERFDEVADLEMNFWLSSHQIEGSDVVKMSLQELVDRKHINENHAYFLGRIYQFLIEIGIDPEAFRFREHLPSELAHYSQSCWDGECLTSLGWIECVGCANRGNYDLLMHSKESGVFLHVNENLEEPKVVPYIACFPNSEAISKIHKNKSNLISKHLHSISQAEMANIEYNINYNREASIHINNQTYSLTKEMIRFEHQLKTVKVESVMPHVIEPSFGIGRILQCVLEHNLYCRSEDSDRVILTLPKNVAPYKVCVLPLLKKSIFESSVKRIVEVLRKSNISHLVDYSNQSIGRRYSRSDQIGVPYVVTIDYKSIDTNLQLVTLRERDSMQQIQIQISDLPRILKDLISNERRWDDVLKQYAMKV